VAAAVNGESHRVENVGSFIDGLSFDRILVGKVHPVYQAFGRKRRRANAVNLGLTVAAAER
jgi:hypothetical protein